MMGFSPIRIWAVATRHLYLLRGSWPRALELLYWPTLNMIIWGFTSQFMMTRSSWVAQASGVFLGAVLLWDVFVRGQLGMTITFLEELWSRNLGHLFVSPLRPLEWIASILVVSLVRVMIGMLPAALLAIPFFGYSVFDMGPSLAAFFLCLVVLGWGLGLMICSVVLLNGLGAEGFAWLAMFALAPISAVYYPVAVLPVPLQYLALALPPAHVFEGMRILMFQHRIAWDHLAWAAGLDVVYMGLGIGVFLWAVRLARVRGKLLQTGE